MEANKRILIAVDDSEASTRAVSYVATMISGGHGFYVRLLHVLPTVPPELLEVGGSEDPKIEAREEAEIREEQAAWLEAVGKAAMPVFERAKTMLRNAKVPARAIETQFFPSVSGERVVTDILEAARAHKCGTVVCGRESFTGLKRFFAHHVGDDLVRQGHGLSIWIVE